MHYQGKGWLIDGMNEDESDRMVIEAWADLDPYQLSIFDLLDS